MSMTVIVTRNVSPRVRGFLASVLLEMAPGVYSAPRLSPAVRDRIWDVLESWFPHEVDASIVMVWQSHDMPGGQDAKMLGTPKIGLVEVDGILLSRREIPSKSVDM
ncbi:type I-E CRISPR-associated endoribonuclease Cas2e [Tepidiphilus sp. HLB4]